METDQLGRIATNYLLLADQKEMGTSDPACKILAEMHSTAVDFSKTEIPVSVSSYTDWSHHCFTNISRIQIGLSTSADCGHCNSCCRLQRSVLQQAEHKFPG